MPYLRSNVYKAIDEERDYQDTRWQDSPSGGHHETAAYLTYIQHYVAVAFEEITKSDDDSIALSTLRKIVALGVACMEDNGVQYRKKRQVP